MSERAEFHVMGQPFDGKPLHYTASGLDYVYLVNGYTVEDHPDYGRILTIQNEGDLQRAIGLYVLTRKRPLTAQEFRFLRKQMGLKQRELAEALGVDEQTVANYEKKQKIPFRSERLMRLTFLLWLTPKDARADLLKRLNDGFKKEDLQQTEDTVPPPSDIQSTIAANWQMGMDRPTECHVH